MRLVAGLGNPGSKYESTRHNLGFRIVDNYVVNAGLVWELSQDWHSLWAKFADCVYVKPQTFMNRSGVAVAAVANFYKIKKADVLVVYDEVDLPFGQIRLSYDGLAAGHKGVESIIRNLGGAEFGRLRVGIGRPQPDTSADTADYVLQDFSAEEKKSLPEIIRRAESAISSYLAEGIEATMNKFN